MPNNHNCTVIHYFEGRLCYQVKDQPDAGTGIWCAGKISIGLLVFFHATPDILGLDNRGTWHRLLSGETLLQEKNSTGRRWDSNPGPCR